VDLDLCKLQDEAAITKMSVRISDMRLLARKTYEAGFFEASHDFLRQLGRLRPLPTNLIHCRHFGRFQLTAGGKIDVQVQKVPMVQMDQMVQMVEEWWLHSGDAEWGRRVWRSGLAVAGRVGRRRWYSGQAQ
jgi:hypothetical protein